MRLAGDSGGRFALFVTFVLAMVSVTSAGVVEADAGRSVPEEIARSELRAGGFVCAAVAGGRPGDVAVVNITNTQAAGDGYGALRRSDDSRVPSRPIEDRYSSVNFAAGTPPNPNLAFATVGTDGRICYDGAVSDHQVILDQVGTLLDSAIDATEPIRILDTRSTGPLAPATSVCVRVPVGDPGDTVVINITNTGASGAGYGALRSSDATPVYLRPAESQFSSVNFAAGTPPNPNLALAAIGSDGAICYDGAVSSHHVILDFNGTIAKAGLTSPDPRRILDSRLDQPLRPSSSMCVAIPDASPGDVAVVNITNTGAVGQGYGTLRSSDDIAVFDRNPSARFSSVNFAASTPPNPNLSIARVGSDGRVCYDGVGAAHHVILDLAATIAASSVSGDEPSRILDTRVPTLSWTGLGDADFGADASTAFDYFSRTFGSPTFDTGWEATGYDPTSQDDQCTSPFMRVVLWSNLTVVFAEFDPKTQLISTRRTFVQYSYNSGEPGDVELGLATDRGLRLGSTSAEVQALYPSATIGNGYFYQAGVVDGILSRGRVVRLAAGTELCEA